MVTLFKRAEVNISHKFATSPDFLVTKGKNLDCIGRNFWSPAIPQDIIKPAALKNNISCIVSNAMRMPSKLGHLARHCRGYKFNSYPKL